MKSAEEWVLEVCERLAELQPDARLRPVLVATYSGGMASPLVRRHLDRLVAAGKLELVVDPRGRERPYYVLPHYHPRAAHG